MLKTTSLFVNATVGPISKLEPFPIPVDPCFITICDATISCAVAVMVKLKEDVAELFVNVSVTVFAPAEVGEKRKENVLVLNAETGVAGVT